MKVPLEQLVEERYALPEWVTVRELRESTGFGNYGSIDFPEGASIVVKAETRAQQWIDYGKRMIFFSTEY